MRALLWVLLIVGTIAAGVLIFVGLPMQADFQSAGSTTPGGVALLLGALLVWPLVGIAMVLIAAWIVRAIWSALKTAFGHDAVSRILSGGIVAFLFSSTLQGIFSPLIGLLFELFARVPAALANDWLTSGLFKLCSQQGSVDAAAACLQPLLGTLLSYGSETLLRFGNRIGGFDVAMLVAALAVWTLLGQFFSAVIQGRSRQGEGSRWADIMESFADRASPSRANLLLFAIIALGATLSASALIAIPVISDSAPLAEKDIQQAQSEVDALLKDVDALPQASPIDGKLADAVKTLRQEFISKTTPASAAAVDAQAAVTDASAEPPRATAKQLEDVLQQLERDADYLEGDARQFWLAVKDSTSRQFGDLKDTAHDLIERQNLAATSLRSKSGYLLDIKNWVAGSVRTTMRQTNMCRAWVEDINNNFRREARYQLEAVRDYPNGWRSRSLVDQFRIPAQMLSSCTGYTASRTPDVAALPSLGPFSFATWLIQLSSMSLTLVAGMLGFGLLGAAISSIVRDRKGRAANEPLVKDLSGLLIRGMSATVVVYLAVKGGLAIFTGTSAPEPNAYVLLLTCFVASVFSDDVWKAAKQWLRNKLSPQGQQSAGDSAAKGDVTQNAVDTASKSG